MASRRNQWVARGSVLMTLALTALAAVMVPLPAQGDPPLPDNAPEAVRQLAELGRQAEQLTEEWHTARSAAEARRVESRQAQDATVQAKVIADTARTDVERYRVAVDDLVAASFQGARFSSLSAILVSESPKDFLDRMSALDMLATDNQQTLSGLNAALEATAATERAASDSANTAAQAEQDAIRLEADVVQRKQAMDQQIARVKDQLARLTGADRAVYRSGGQTDYQVTLPPGSGIAQQAMQKALTQQGKPYVWAAEGPDSYDCSGLLYWSYRQLGVTLPRPSRSQATVGVAVPRSQVQPGDFIAFYSPISHIGIYVGSDKLVHAPQGGDVVKVSPVNWGDVTAIRRFTG